MDAGTRYSVVVIGTGGMRDVRASNISLETAQAIQLSLVNDDPAVRVAIEPPPPDTHRPGIGDTWRP